jgi:hypothetical protein
MNQIAGVSCIFIGAGKMISNQSAQTIGNTFEA